MSQRTRERDIEEAFNGILEEELYTNEEKWDGTKVHVYQLRKGYGNKELSALKEVRLLSQRGKLSEKSADVRKSYAAEKDRLVALANKEVEMLYNLRGCTNIVLYLQSKVVDWEDPYEFGCSLLIEMPLMESLSDLIKSGYVFQEDEVLKIGRQVCTALVQCHERNVLHRDVNPRNIFRNKQGNYELGDFDISKVLENSQMAMTGISTKQFGAPEQVFGNGYDYRADIYSLGLTLYVLCNNNCMPFAKEYEINRNSPECAKRILGKPPLPRPCSASDELSKIIMKACSHSPDDRYQNAQDLLDELDELARKVRTHGVGKPGYLDRKKNFVKSLDPDATQYAEPNYKPQSPAQMRESSDEIPCESIAKDFIIKNGVLVKYCGQEKSVVLPEGIVEIGAGAFRESQLESISIGADVKRVGENAFLRCQNLISITLPDSVTSIADSAFGLCIGLTNINVASGNSEYISVDGVLFNMNRAVLHTYPCGKSGQSYRIPSFVTSIGKRAFKGCESLTSVIIPNSVICIGDCAFYACHHLTDVTISNGITYVGDKAFCECLNLTSVTIPNSVTAIGDYAFYGCLSLTSVTIPNSVTSIGWYAFDMCHTLTDVYYGGSEGQWRQIAISEYGNESLTSATIHYNSTGIAQAQEPSNGTPLNEISKETLGIPIDDLIDMTESSGKALHQFVLGLYYMNGSGVSKDEATATKWFKKAAEQGLDKAQCILGLHYMNGIGVPKDETIAAEWFTKAAVQGYAAAQRYLGKCYERGVGVHQDETIAVEWLAKAAEQGDKDAQFGLGFHYMAGNGVSKNEAIAVEWLTKAAKQGDEDAQYLLGECYMEGVGIPQDEAMAVEWFTKAAKQNHVSAERRWGICLLSGNGTPRNTTKAAEWLSKAASQGDSEAQFLLGCCYMFGEGVPKNLEKAIGWYSKAADQEVSDAQYILGFCYEHGEGIPVNISVAVQWYAKSAEQGNVYAQYALRKCCSISKGTIKDYLKSVVFQVEAEERGDAYIQDPLMIFRKHVGMYEKGG